MWQKLQTFLPRPGDQVWIRRRPWRVERVVRDERVLRLEVRGRDGRRTFLAPFDRTVAARRVHGPTTVTRREAAARCAGLLARAAEPRLPLALIDADADIFPYQIEPALAALAGHARLLLADEVGLGKTIQAGLVIAELLRRDVAPRVLIVTPATLSDQWAAELRRRFAVDSQPASRTGLDAAARDVAVGTSPWSSGGVWIGSPDFLKQPGILASMPAAFWDLVVIDEAHLVCGDTERYRACRELAVQSRRVVLITATPHGGDRTRFDRLLSLGRATNAERLVVFRRTRRDLGVAPRRRVRWHRFTLSPAEAAAIDTLRAFERAVLARAGAGHREATLLLLSVFRKRALSSFAALTESIDRRLAWLGDAGTAGGPFWTQPSLGFGDVDADETEDEARRALAADIGVDPRIERAWLGRLRVVAGRAAASDTRLRLALALVRRTTEPVAVFTEFRDTLDTLAARLRRGRSIAVLHGGQGPAERRAELRRFLSGPASVLVATDVAGQGLNLQSRARWVISLELPWNPVRLEQRIGRVDRIGQTRPTHFTLLVARHDAEDGLLSHLARRVLDARLGFSPTALDSVSPPEARVRERLLLPRPARAVPAPGQSTIRPPAPPVVIGRFRRPAIVVATALARRRALARHWQGPHPEHGGFVTASWPCLPAGVDRSTGWLICTVPIRDPRGDVVEQVPLAIALPLALTGDMDWPAVADAIQTAARRQLARRVRRAAAAAAAAHARLTTRERALVAMLAAVPVPAPQPGLFDRSAINRNAAHEARLAALAHQAEARARALGGEDDWRADPPVLHLLFTR